MLTHTIASLRSDKPALATAAAALSLTLLLATLTGCGLGKSSGAPAVESSAPTAALSGRTFGGPNPIIGATVKLYTTGNSDGTNGGYGVATMRQEANAVTNTGGYPSGDTDPKGIFLFAGGYTCPAGQFAYLVSSGGNTGAATAASGATATANTVGVVSNLQLTNGGSGYTAPTVTITPSDSNGSGATATASMSGGVVTGLILTASGTGYDAPPIVTINDPTGVGATATADQTFLVGTITVTAGGTGYLSATVTITPADSVGSGATATAVINSGTGVVSSIKVTNPGGGYDTTPIVTITSPSVVNPANNQAVLVAALGRCEDLYNGAGYSGPTIYINELTTVAAAYALGHFSSVTGTGAGTAVLIGAPATNNAAQIGGVSTGCVAGVSTCTTTAAAGLAHAFLNAAMLVNPFTNTSMTGANSTVTPAYSTYISGYAGAVPIVPTALINSIANILVSCVNSAGGVASDGSACGTIFKYTTLPAAITQYYTYSTATPTNTFTAMVNLAANPSISGSTSNVANLFAVAGPFTSIYSPALAAAPPQDFTIAINYPETGSGTLGTGVGNSTAVSSVCATAPCQGLGFTFSAALDINDILYVGNTSTSSGTVPQNLLAFSSNGRLLGMTTNSASLKNAIGLSVDALGNGYFTTGSASSSNNFAYFKTGGGSLGSLTGGGTMTLPTIKTVGSSFNAYATAVDRANNLWVSGTGATLYEGPSGGLGPYTSYTVNSVTVSSTLKNMGLQVDPNQNVWATAGPGSPTTDVTVLQNTGTVAAPVYTSGTNASGATSVGPVGGITFAGSPYEAFIAGDNTTPGVQPWTPTFGSGVNVSSISSGTLSIAGSLTGADQLEADSTGALFVTNYNNSTLDTMFFATGYGSATGYKWSPCVAATLNATTCTALFNSTTQNKPQWVAIDSTGSVWFGDGGTSTDTTGGALMQVIGAAAPTWPLLSLGQQNQMP
jgi:hypothetical protein